jgi:uncharacterized delta-60 repeat protein
MNRKTFLFFIFILTLTIFAQTSNAQMSGLPDPSFGTNGRALLEVKNFDYFWYYDTALQPDGKILALGGGSYGGVYVDYLILARFHPNGVLDEGFADSGVKSIRVEPWASNSYSRGEGNSLGVQPDGKIIVAAVTNSDFGIMRLNPDGSFDDTFGISGIAKTDFAEFDDRSTDRVLGLAFRADGKILVYGESQSERTYAKRPALAQYNPDGSLDVSFGVGGIQKAMFSESQSVVPSGVVIQPNGKILMSGFYSWLAWNGYYYIPGFVRFNADGTLDLSFGTNGYLLMKTFNKFYVPSQDGKFMAVSVPFDDGLAQTCPIRFTLFNPNLTTDMSYGGVSHTLLAGGIADVDVQPDGKIILSTFANNYPNIAYIHRTTVYRFNPDGSVDTSFGTNGASVFDLDGRDKVGATVAKSVVQSDGKIVVSGAYYPIPIGSYSISGERGIALTRLIGTNSKRGFSESIFPAR